MEKKTSTRKREIRRKYEQIHKEELKANTMTWGTSISRKTGEEINDFIKNHENVTKVNIVLAGYMTIKEQYEKLEEERKNSQQSKEER